MKITKWEQIKQERGRKEEPEYTEQSQHWDQHPDTAGIASQRIGDNGSAPRAQQKLDQHPNTKAPGVRRPRIQHAEELRVPRILCSALMTTQALSSDSSFTPGEKRTSCFREIDHMPT